MHSAAPVLAPCPQQADLTALYADSAFRADMLFFIRLCGAYCQNIFWQAFPRTAKTRRQALFALLKNGLPQKDGKTKAFGGDFREAMLNPQRRRAQTADILNHGFIALLSALAQMPAPQRQAKIYEIFSKGLEQRHGLPWNLDEFIAAAQSLITVRHFLEHYEQRVKENKDIPSARENAQFLYCLGLLLLPHFCNELEHCAKRLKTAQARDAAAQMALIFAHAKQARSEGIKAMFAEARARKNAYAPGQERTKSGKYKNKTQKSRELLSGKWRKYYYGLKLAPTDLRENNFKRHYDFIGEQNFKQICAKLGAPLAAEKLKNFSQDNPRDKNFIIYSSAANRLSFKNEILPFYIITQRLQKTLHFHLTEYAEKIAPPSAAERRDMSKKQRNKAGNEAGKIKCIILRAIRNQIAHSGLFWLIKKPEDENSVFSETEIFQRIMRILTPQNPLIADAPAPRPATLYNAVKDILNSENCPIAMVEKTETDAPAAVKLKKETGFARRQKQKQARAKGKTEPRKALRFALRKWLDALKNARDNVRKKA